MKVTKGNFLQKNKNFKRWYENNEEGDKDRDRDRNR